MGRGAGWARAASGGQFIALGFWQILSDVEHFTRKHLVTSSVLTQHHRDCVTLLFPILVVFPVPETPFNDGSTISVLFGFF